MKSPYAKLIKIFDKSEQVIISRYEDKYALCNRYIAVKVSPETYDSFFRPAKVYYQPLEPGQTIKYFRANKKTAPMGTIAPEFIDLESCWPVDVRSLPLAVKSKYGMLFESSSLNIFATTDWPVLVNSDYVAALEDIWQGEVYSAGRFKPLCFGEGAIVLPVNRGKEIDDVLRAIVASGK